MKLISIFILFLIPCALALDKPHFTGFVNDYADVLSSECESKIASLCRDIEQNTTAEIAVVTMKSLEGEDLEMYANELFRENGVGKTDVNNGLMILVFIEDREYRVEVGYGLEGTIPDVRASHIAEDNLVPKFKQGDYCGGLYDTVDEIGKYIIAETTETSQVPTENKPDTSIIIWIGIILFIVLLGIVIFNSFDSSSGKSETSKSEKKYDGTAYVPVPLPFPYKKKKKDEDEDDDDSDDDDDDDSDSHSSSSSSNSGGFSFGGGSSGGGGASGRW